jgi:hypothetical protein
VRQHVEHAQASKKFPTSMVVMHINDNGAIMSFNTPVNPDGSCVFSKRKLVCVDDMITLIMTSPIPSKNGGGRCLARFYSLHKTACLLTLSVFANAAFFWAAGSCLHFYIISHSFYSFYSFSHSFSKLLSYRGWLF